MTFLTQGTEENNRMPACRRACGVRSPTRPAPPGASLGPSGHKTSQHPALAVFGHLSSTCMVPYGGADYNGDKERKVKGKGDYMATMDTLPTLLTLRGRIDDRVLEDAIAVIVHGHVPGWRVIQDSTDTQKAMSAWRQWLSTIGTLISASSSSGSTTPTQIRTIVLEHQPQRRTETLKFKNLGEYNGASLWARILG